MIDNLIEKAKECSADKRTEVVSHVTDLFVRRSGQNQPKEINLYNGLLEGMVDSVDVDTRQSMSEKLCKVDQTSSILAKTLAADELQIAQSMLENSKSLTQKDLMELAKTKGQGHLLALSKRKHIDPDLTKLLLERGHTEVRQSVAMNLGAEITKEDFERVVKDMPKQLGDRLRHLRKSNEELIKDLFNDDEASTGEPLVPKPMRTPVEQWLYGIKMGKVSVNNVVSQMAMAKNLHGVMVVLSQLADLDEKYVHNLMIRFDATGIATLCRAVGLGAMEYSSVSKARAKHLKFPESTANKWLTNYHALDANDAERLLALMRIKLRAVDKPGTAKEDAA
ncbi:DUF2336 domain-containing protein [Roseibium hamelinense]|nr:DUF2336 domain-containing protein [Roseibium hamelinense]MTI43723.1 DUF2336 domain-containing protein [Roseibium hamelinense]